MQVENRKRMKRVALILGTITFLIIILASYKLFIAKQSTQSKTIPHCQLDLLEIDSTYRKDFPIQLVIRGKYLGVDTRIISGPHIFDGVLIGDILCNSTSFSIKKNDTILLLRGRRCLVIPNDNAYHTIYVENSDTLETGELAGEYTCLNIIKDTCMEWIIPVN